MSGKKLVIVESPTKARTIGRFLGNDYEVISSYGHVRDLPKSKLGVQVEKNFEPIYSIPPKAKGAVSEIKKTASKSKEVILAADEDREGEAIAWHITQALDQEDVKNEKKSKKINFKRIVFHEITEKAIKNALKNPRELNMNLVDAQQARRVLDRLVGYELSPFLWRKIKYGLSAGRVQSVAVRLIVEREREIQKFKKDEYWTIELEISKKSNKVQFKAKLRAIKGKVLGKMDIKSETEAKKICKNLENKNFFVKDLTKKETNRYPSPPFTTSTLQQEAARKFGFSAKQTMLIAQRLYENGFITYMRTDSFNLSNDALSQSLSVIEKLFGKEYSLPEPRRYKNKGKTQEAHEAIRPTNINKKNGEELGIKDNNQKKLYEIIWKRTIASQMQNAVIIQTTADLESAEKEFILRSSGQKIKFDGFIKVYTEGKDEKDEDENGTTIPDLEKGEEIDIKKINPNQHFTEPPPRYNDATLVKALETNGIGRPSTYAPTLSTIQERDYVNKTEKKYHPTEIGVVVNDILVKHFPEIVDIGFTSKVEKELDEIAEGQKNWVEVCRDFYTPFKDHLSKKENTVEKYKELSDTPCPHCGEKMIFKFGRAGKFLACPDPESKITLPAPEEAEKIKELSEKTKDEKCPNCKGKMDVKKSRFGFFLKCKKYPECKTTSKILNRIGFKCPSCKEGDMVERKSRGRGKTFYGCSKYPDCNFVANKKPENEEDLKKFLEIWEKKKDEKLKKESS